LERECRVAGAIPASINETEDTEMGSATLTHGVTIRRTSAGSVEVSIQIEDTIDGNDEQVILNGAWAQLAQAIADHKQAAMDANPNLAVSGTDEHAPTVADAAGSGAWWAR
jgi:hypothetical protein